LFRLVTLMALQLRRRLPCTVTTAVGLNTLAVVAVQTQIASWLHNYWTYPQVPILDTAYLDVTSNAASMATHTPKPIHRGRGREVSCSSSMCSLLGRFLHP